MQVVCPMNLRSSFWCSPFRAAMSRKGGEFHEQSERNFIFHSLPLLLLFHFQHFFDAVYNPNSSANEILDRKMAEYAQAVCHGRPHFHIVLVQDISPNCDCHGENDAPILPDIGMFASFDPVALDQACADACLKATPIANSQLGEHLAEPGWHCHHDHFKDSNPNIEWEATLDQAEKIGLGTRQYELKRIK